MRYAFVLALALTLTPLAASAQGGPMQVPPPAGYANPVYLPEMLRDTFYHLSFTRAAPYLQRAPNWVLNYVATGTGPINELPTYRSTKSAQSYSIAPIARRSWRDGQENGSRAPQDRAFFVFLNGPEPLMWLYTVTDGYGEWFGVPPADIRNEVEALYAKLDR